MRRAVNAPLIGLIWLAVGCGSPQDTDAAWKILHAACRIVNSWEVASDGR